MNRIDATFSQLKAQGKKALIAYLTAGDPDYAKSKTILLDACKAGVDILELGVPFSDPTADGPVIQEASQRALAKGMDLPQSLQLAAELRKEVETPIVLFSYYNPLLQYGPAKLYTDALAAGIDGLLIVDLPPEESAELTSHFPDPARLPLIRLIAPTTPLDRQKQVAAAAQGFVYLISRTGVTGTGGLDVPAIAHHAAETRSVTQVPVCVGFGISTPDDVRSLAPHVDGVIIGSALVKLAHQGGDVAARVRELAAVLHT